MLMTHREGGGGSIVYSIARCDDNQEPQHRRPDDKILTAGPVGVVYACAEEQ